MQYVHTLAMSCTHQRPNQSRAIIANTRDSRTSSCWCIGFERHRLVTFRTRGLKAFRRTAPRRWRCCRVPYYRPPSSLSGPGRMLGLDRKVSKVGL